MTPGPFSGGSAWIAAPRFSIVTSSFNHGHFLAETLRSVRDQGRDDVEHIVIDGGSTDGTVEILREFDGSLAYWVSAPDAGQPAAWNEGVRRSRGDVLGFLNSDDLYLPGGLDEIARLADHRPDADWLIGGTAYFGDGPGLEYPGLAPACATDILYFNAYAPQPGHFWRRSLLDRVGPFDETLHYTFDFDYVMRCVLAAHVAVATPRLVAKFRFHAASKSVAGREIQLAEGSTLEAKYWPEVERREGSPARRARATWHGYLSLHEARERLEAGDRGRAFRILVATAQRYPIMLPTRAFLGTVQRLMGLRFK
ncbi:MAG: glycosyltransferase family 2 protein [bacterium]